MNTWNANFESHDAWRKQGELSSELLRIMPYVSKSTESIALHTRLTELANRVEQFKTKLSPDITSKAYLNKLAEGLERIISHIRNKEESEINTALLNASVALDDLAFDSQFFLNDSNAASAAQKSNTDLASNLLETFKISLANSETQLAEIAKQVAARQQEIEATRTAITTDLTSFKSAETSKVDTAINDLQQSAKATISEIEKKLEEAQKLVSIISNHGVIGGYQKAANSERIEKWLWQAATAGTLICLIVYATDHLASNIEWVTLVPRSLIAGAFIALASYAGLQAEKHRKAEQKNRRLELGLAAIDPFLANLDPQERDKLKQNLISSLFEKDSDEDKVTNPISNSTLDMLERLKNMLK